jgi:amino acid adenylation domain-containing protein
MMSRAGVMAADGKCKTFDASADGYVRAEGGGVLILKNLDEALEAGDNILGVIRGTAITHDGHSNGLTSPSGKAQAELLNTALADADLLPADVDYLECHGTGTYVGDPIEVGAIKTVFQDRNNDSPLKLGSVKSNIGHLEQAAGIAGIIKILLSFAHNTIPANLHFKNENPLLELSAIPASVVSENVVWKGDKRKRIAGVSGFSLAGANAHVLLEEPPHLSRKDDVTEPLMSSSWQLLPLSAESPESLAVVQQKMSCFMKEASASLDTNFGYKDICRSAQLERDHYEYRSFVVGDNLDSLAAQLESAPSVSDDSGSKLPRVAFLFTGQGAQRSGMGKELLNSSVFKESLEQCSMYMDTLLDIPLERLLFDANFSEKLLQTAYAQPALFAFEYSLAQLWLSWGIRPTVFIGHSLGEYTAACLSGVFSLEAGCRLVTARGRLMQQTAAGEMYSVFAEAGRVREIITAMKEDACIAAVNGPEHTVVSGKKLGCLVQKLAEKGFSTRRLGVAQGFHSSLMDGILDEFSSVASNIVYGCPEIPIISNLTGTLAETGLFDAEYWREHIRNTVQFESGIKALDQVQCSHLLEIGPDPVLCNMGRRILTDSKMQWIPSIVNSEDEWKTMLCGLGQLYADGFNPVWQNVSTGGREHKVQLPLYPFEARRYWAVPKPGNADKLKMSSCSSSAGMQEEDNKKVSTAEILEPAIEGGTNGLQFEMEKYIETKVTKILCLPEGTSFHKNRSLASLGTDSIMAMELLAQIKKDKGVTLKPKEIMGGEGIAGIASRIIEEISKISEAAILEDELLTDQGKAVFEIQHDDIGSSDPFTLTSVQHAYWVGRNGGLELSDVSCFLYTEIDIPYLDIPRLESSINTLITRHDSLRTVISADGMQRVLADVSSYALSVKDLREDSSSIQVEKLESIRHKFSHQNRNSEKWPLFDIRVTISDKGYRVHAGVDLLIVDAWSFGILLRDLIAIYADRELMPRPRISFRDYVVSQQNFLSSDIYKAARNYWESQLDELPAGPELPLLPAQAQTETRFKRYTGKLDAEQWQKLQLKSREYGVTPSVVLLAAFSSILAQWSQQDRFSLMLTLFNRLPVHEDINGVIGDFTSLLLLRTQVDGSPFSDYVASLQQQLWQDMEHRHVCAVDVLRMLKQKKGTGNEIYAPVVFTSMLPLTSGGSDFSNALESIENMFGEMRVAHCITQTPQVRFDHQVYERKGCLCFNWDIAQGVFPDGMIEDMLDAYSALLLSLVEEVGTWNNAVANVLPARQQLIRENINSTSKKFKDTALHSGFIENANHSPERPAIILPKKELTYGELLGLANGIACWLKDNDFKAGGMVGVISDGWRKIPAVLGILMAGGVYLPLAPDAPARRSLETLERAEAKHILGDKSVLDVLDDFDHAALALEEIRPAASFSVHPVQPHDPAYVIYTSGSTGRPKGVLITHEAACNTILDINERNNVVKDDHILGISRLNFDLSVYDIFGALHAGAAIVVPDPEDRTDPAHWLSLMNERGISVWNSVPALMSMLLDYTELAGVALPDDLRLVLLSGDWIPLDLPKRLQDKLSNVKIVAMGGATEASIWSNAFDIKEVSPKWNSIPYGFPLANQGFHVLNSRLEHRPEWVQGDLYITGKGLAVGYFKEPELTEASFFVHPETGERMYKTGDRGRYLPDGSLEFLGRQDTQVKIRGHRIELGEIEHSLCAIPAVKQAVAKVSEASQSIVAYLTVDNEAHGSELNRTYIAEGEYLQRISAISKLNFIDSVNQARPSDSCSDIYYSIINSLSVNFMYRVLSEIGAIKYLEKGTGGAALAADCGIAESYIPVLDRWINVLEKEHALSFKNGLYKFEERWTPPSCNTDQLSGIWAECAAELAGYLDRLFPFSADLLTGTVEPLEIFFNEENRLSPEILTSCFPWYHARVDLAAEAISSLYDQFEKPLEILEVGGRTGLAAEKLLSALSGKAVNYTLSDNSSYFVEKQKDRLLSDYSYIDFTVFDPLLPLYSQSVAAHSKDIVIASSYVHRTPRAKETIKKLKELLRPGGLLLFLEETENSLIQECTVAFLEKGFTGFEDERQETGRPLMDAETWSEYLKQTGFSGACDLAGARGLQGQACMIGFTESEVFTLDTDFAFKELARSLPEYMLPQHIVQLDEFPLTVNGKIDKKALVDPLEPDLGKQKSVLPQTEEERFIAGLWHELLPDFKISTDENFFTAGGDSLLGVKFVAEMHSHFGIDVPLRWLFEYPTIADLAAAVAEAVDERRDDPSIIEAPKFKPDMESLHEPFPLTDVQYAYWVGKMGIFSLGDVSTHCYFEIESHGLDVERLISCWQRLIEQHAMMRAVVAADGQSQRILEDVPVFEPQVTSIPENASPAEVEKILTATRNRLSHLVLPSDVWPLFTFEITTYGSDFVRLHVGFENIMFDGWSMLHLLSEWTRLYREESAVLEPFEFSFRDYVLMLEASRSSQEYAAARKYWIERLPSLPDAPKLPTRREDNVDVSGGFCRRQFSLDAETWSAFQNVVRMEGLTPAGVLLSAYAEILSVWSRDDRFTINVTLFDRLQGHPDVNRLVGDFTTLTLLAVDTGGISTFTDRARRLQKRLWEDRDHSAFSGVEVIREMNAGSDGSAHRIMPVVFTSALGVESSGSDKGLNLPGDFVYGISQTPQVWLDHQVYEMNGELLLVWDSVEGLFPEGLLDNMFESYEKLLISIAGNSAPDDSFVFVTEKAMSGFNLKPVISSDLESALRSAVDLPAAVESWPPLKILNSKGNVCPDWVDGEIHIVMPDHTSRPTGILARQTPEGVFEAPLYEEAAKESLTDEDTERPEDHVVSASPVENELLSLWQQQLENNDLISTDNFFASGGNSLVAARLMGVIRKHFHCELPLRLLFDAPTVRSFAPHLEAFIGDNTDDLDGGII